MILKDVAGILNRRRPNFGLNSTHKVLYITYPLLLEPLVLSVTNNIPATREVISNTFIQSLKEYGFDIENLKELLLNDLNHGDFIITAKGGYVRGKIKSKR